MADPEAMKALRRAREGEGKYYPVSCCLEKVHLAEGRGGLTTDTWCRGRSTVTQQTLRACLKAYAKVDGCKKVAIAERRMANDWGLPVERSADAYAKRPALLPELQTPNPEPQR